MRRKKGPASTTELTTEMKAQCIIARQGIVSLESCDNSFLLDLIRTLYKVDDEVGREILVEVRKCVPHRTTGESLLHLGTLGWMFQLDKANEVSGEQ